MKTKRTLIVTCMALALAAGTGSMTAFAAAETAGKSSATVSCNYVDNDNDGICDNCGSRQNYVDNDNDGICDNHGQGHNRGGGCASHSRGHGCRRNR